MPRRGALATNLRSTRSFFPRADWLWLPIPANPVFDWESSQIAATLAAGTKSVTAVNYSATLRGPGGITAATPRYDVVFANQTGGSAGKNWGPDPFPDSMPIPNGVPLPSGTDKHLSVADPVNNRVYNLWQAVPPGTTWGASWGAATDLHGDGRELGGGSSTGSNMARYAGVVTVAEVAAGRIDHAMFFATDIARLTTFRYPATKTDGKNTAGSVWTIPEGGRIQLDPSIDLDAISGITQFELIFGRALQKYGAYCGDNGGTRLGFILEYPDDADPATDYVGATYTAAGVPNEYYNMPHIPWSGLRVLAQWDGDGTRVPTCIGTQIGTKSGTDVTATPLTGVRAGDYQIVVISVGASGETITSVPAGWTLLGQGAGSAGDTYQMLVYASTTDTGTANWVKSGTRETQVVRAAWRGVASAGTPAGPVINGTTTTHATPAVTPSQANSVVVGIATIDNPSTSSWTPPTGWTERFDNSTSLQSITIADVVVPSPTSTTGTFTSSLSDEALTFAIVLAPA